MPMKAQKQRSKMKSISNRIDRAASVYDPDDRLEKSNTSISANNSKILAGHMKQMMSKGNGSALDTDTEPILIPSGHITARRHKRLTMVGGTLNVKKKMGSIDQGTVERYKRLQASSLEYMHLIETEARKLLEVQHQVMQASLHLEHIRKEFGGYVTSTTVLNSGERGSKEEMAKEKAFFEQHVSNLESEVVAHNTMVSKEIIVQEKMKSKIDNQRRVIWTKKKALVIINNDIESFRKNCKKYRVQVHELKNECTKEKGRMNRMKATEKVIVNKLAKEISRVHQQKMDAATQFKNNMTSSKQEVERQRRKVNLERLATQPRRPQTAASGTNRKSLRSRVKTKNKKQRPRTAGGKLIYSNNKNVINKAEIMKGSRQQSNAKSKKKDYALFGGQDDDDDDEDEEDEEEDNNKNKTKKISPPSLRPTFENDPHALHDPTKNPKIWFPGRAQCRSDPYADHSVESQSIPSPLGRRGSLVGRAPGRFGSPSKLSGRLELLLSTLPEIENKKKEIKKRGIAMSWKLARKEAKEQKVSESIKELEKMFDGIREKTGIDTIEAFAQAFLESEARQFTVVKQVEELESKLSSSQANNTLLKKEIEHLQKKANDSTQHSLFTKIQTEISTVKHQEKIHRTLLSTRKNQIRNCITSVENLLSVVDSKNARVVTGLNEEQAKYIEDLLEPTNGVTDHLLPQCLGSIEERVLQLLQINEIKNYHQQKRKQASRPNSRNTNGSGSSSRPGSRMTSHPTRPNSTLNRDESYDSLGNNIGAPRFNINTPTARRPTTFGEMGVDSRTSTKKVGGNLPVVEQVRKKFQNSPAWVLKMAVDMRSRLDGEDDDQNQDFNEDELERQAVEEERVRNEETENHLAELERTLDTPKNNNNNKFWKNESTKSATSLTGSGRIKASKRSTSPDLGIQIIMPRDEELISSSDEDENEDSNNRTSMKRPISRAEMKRNAMDIAKRRKDIEKFLGTNHALQRERNRFKMSHLDSKPDTYIKKGYRAVLGKREKKELEAQRKKEEEERWAAEANAEFEENHGLSEEQIQLVKEGEDLEAALFLMKDGGESGDSFMENSYGQLKGENSTK